MQKSNSFKSQKPVIAIDGTAGSGKGTLAKKIANLIKFDHLDTGLLYRICALEMLERKVNLKNIDIASWFGKNKDLSILRSEKVSKETSKISKDPKVRKFLLKFQRDFGDYPPNGFGSVVDGRDTLALRHYVSVAEWLRRGLQILVCEFDSHRSLQFKRQYLPYQQ